MTGNPCRLLSLAQELQDEILQYCFDTNVSIDDDYKTPGLLLTCKHFYYTGLKMFYETARFHIPSPGQARKWLRRLPVSSAERINYLRLEWLKGQIYLAVEVFDDDQQQQWLGWDRIFINMDEVTDLEYVLEKYRRDEPAVAQIPAKAFKALLFVRDARSIPVREKIIWTSNPRRVHQQMEPESNVSYSIEDEVFRRQEHSQDGWNY